METGIKKERFFDSGYRFPWNFTKAYLRPYWWSNKYKHIVQRYNYGVSRQDAWSLDYHLTCVILVGIEHIRNEKVGYPSTLNSIEEWHAILDEIHEGFYLYYTDDWDTIFNEEKREKFEHSFDLFKEWFGALWT